MSILSDNIRFLRNRKSLSQQKVADNLSITRGRYAKYEDGLTEPPIGLLIRISRFFNVSIDLLVSVDIRKYDVENMLLLPDNRVVLPIAVDEHGDNKIEIIPHKASMGYLSGYMNPAYIESLQNISLPFLSNGKFRAFPAEGDSMPPFKDGTFIVGEYIESITELKENKTYIFVTQSEGIVYKRFQKRHGNQIRLCSDNAFYAPYDLPISDILEVWKYACSISTAEFEPEDSDTQIVQAMFLELRKDIRNLEDQIKEQHS